jgi:ribosomal protein S1
VLSQLQVGAIEKGIVRNIVPFGAFVNIHGVDGLLHVSELAWRRITDPTEIVQVGQEIEVYILEVDLEHERLGLSLKRLSPDPWLSVSEKYHDGQIVEVKIVSVTTYGAFATLTEVPNIEGLIHISELSDRPVEHVRDVVRVGEVRNARIISLRPKDRRIAFSLKNVDAELSHEPEKVAA